MGSRRGSLPGDRRLGGVVKTGINSQKAKRETVVSATEKPNKVNNKRPYSVH
jgi:hypothetical protein